MTKPPDDNIIPFSKTPKTDAPPSSDETTPDDVLRDVLGHLEKVVVIGLLKDGRKIFSSSTMSVEDITYLLDRAHHQFHVNLDRAEDYSKK